MDVTDLQLGTDRPEIREGGMHQRAGQILGAGGATGPTACPDRALHHLDVTIPPFLEPLIQIHEAFAAQTLATLKAWESEQFCRERLGRERPLGSIDRSKLNVKGGSVAVGHPFAATGTRIVATLAKLLRERGSGRGLISVCTAGGMGVTAILEAA